MATENAGLFTTPEQYQALQDQLAYQQAVDTAKLTPAQAASANVGYGLYNIGRGIGGIFGGTDPQLQLVSQRQALAKDVDFNDPKSLMDASIKFGQIGDLQYATAFADRAKALQESITKQMQESSAAGKNIAEAGKISSEQQRIKDVTQQLMSQYNLTEAEASAVATNPDLVKSYYTPKSAQAMKLLETGKYNPSSVAKWQAGEGELEPIDKYVKPDSKFITKAVDLGFGEKTKIGDYTQQQVGAISKALFEDEIKLAAARAMNVRVGVDVKAQEAGAVKSAELDAKRLDEARTAAAKAQDQKQILATMQQALPNIVSGTGAQARTSFLNLLQTAGLASPEDQNKLASSELFNSLAGERVLSFIKTLGTNPTDTDREFARTIGPALEKGTKSNKDIINYLSKRADSIINNASAMENHYYENKYSLRGFKPSNEVIPVATPSQNGWSIKKKP